MLFLLNCIDHFIADIMWLSAFHLKLERLYLSFQCCKSHSKICQSQTLIIIVPTGNHWSLRKIHSYTVLAKYCKEQSSRPLNIFIFISNQPVLKEHRICHLHINVVKWKCVICCLSMKQIFKVTKSTPNRVIHYVTIFLIEKNPTYGICKRGAKPILQCQLSVVEGEKRCYIIVQFKKNNMFIYNI